MGLVETNYAWARGRPSCLGAGVSTHISGPLHALLNSAAEKQKMLDSLKTRIDNEISNKHSDLVGIGDDLHNVSAELKHIADGIDEASAKTSDGFQLGIFITELENTVNALKARLGTSPLKEKCREQEKWVKAGFDKELIITDPEAVHFAVESKLIYTIAMFQNSADILEGEKLTIKNNNGIALFKVEGKWIPYSDFKDRIVYSTEECRFIGWNFVHPDGFIPRDWAEYDYLYPIAKITPEAYQRVKAHADQVWTKDLPEIDPGVEKGYILQVMTTGRDLLHRSWLTKNFIEHFPEHGSARIITPEGLVYSFGTKMRGPDEEFLCHPETYLGTGLSNVPTPDYEESRPSDDRLMTFMPISKARFEKEMDFVHRANKGLCFNFSRQNCIRFIENILRIGGAEMSTKMSISELVGNIVPNLSDIPILGKPMAALCDSVKCAVSPIFDALSSAFSWIMPFPVKKVVECIGWAVNELLRRIEALFWTTVGLLFMGATESIVPEERLNAKDLPEVETFRRFMDWSDLGNPEALRIYYVTKLKEWIRQRPNALIFKKPQYGFCCFDPIKGEACSPLTA